MAVMLIERRLRLLTTLLAAKRSNDPEAPRRVFVKERTIPKGADPNLVYIKSDLLRWEWAFLEARDELGYNDVSLGAIIPTHWYSTKKTSTFNRSFRRGKSMSMEPFESISIGHIIHQRFTLSRHLPPGTDGNGRFTRVPDEVEFDAMLAYIGEELGMSEWGHARKLGRFEIRPPITNDETDNERPAADTTEAEVHASS